MSLTLLKKSLKKQSDPQKKKVYAKFFKTGRGEYGYGDKFIGVTVPKCRKVSKQFINLPLSKVEKLLNSKIHEERLVALLILIEKYEKGDLKERNKIFRIYLKNTKNINNWDLVDISSHKIIGKHLINKNRKLLYKLASSNNLWEKRISIISTFYFIKNKQYKDSLKIAEALLEDNHDLIHKAVGWMLREIGKKDLTTEEKFLKKHYKNMPRTMLRYAIEKFPEKKRQAYLKGNI
jgi:3-methyladenine DNA glycosylase AlkD